MGSRRLREWVRYPLIDEGEIVSRQQQVTHLVQNDAFSTWHELSENMNDIERLLAKICVRVNNPKDMLGLSHSLASIQSVQQWVQSLNTFYNTIVGIVSH